MSLLAAFFDQSTEQSADFLTETGGQDSAVLDDAAAEALRLILARELIYPVFQPIVHGSAQQIIGYEALTRGPAGSLFESPVALFSGARTLGLESECEIMCRKASIRRFAALKLPGRLFLNVSPQALLNPAFRKGRTLQYLREFGVDADRVVIEVTEYDRVSSYEGLKLALNHYRSMGFQVALDDLGSAYSGLRLWSELLPDFIKVDKYFTRDIHRDSVKANFLRGVATMASASRCRVIAEGVECADEMDMLLRLNIPFLQGYHFARPSATPPLTLDSALFPESAPIRSALPSHEYDNLLRITRTVNPEHPETRVEKVLALFQQSPQLQTLPLVENDQALGLVDRQRFFNRLMETQYGLALYAKHPIREFMETEVMQVELDSDLAAVSQKVTTCSSSSQAFIVSNQGRYFGIATILDLLEIITEQKVQNARHANPLTLLPGIVPMNSLINGLLTEGKPFSVAYFDLDNFKPYNDAYGYEAGDKIIRCFASLLSEAYGQEQGSVGHIGGDDFLVVDRHPGQEEQICARIFSRFSEEISTFYNEEHLQAGGIQSCDRSGRESFYPLLSVSVGVVPASSSRDCRSHIDISDLASEAKKVAKRSGGSTCFINRRLPLNMQAGASVPGAC